MKEVNTSAGEEATQKNNSQIVPMSEGPGPDDKLLYEWGKHKNSIWKLHDGGIAGFGRATTFSDKIGQADNILKKGDVATSLRYDNCKYGTKIELFAPKKGTTVGAIGHTMYKRDAGGLPDAVIDIWKTGVEYWGYKWTSTLSINDVFYFR